jgi:hypothetical protein
MTCELCWRGCHILDLSYITTHFLKTLYSQMCLPFPPDTLTDLTPKASDQVIRLFQCKTPMSWYRISFPPSEASTKIAELALDFYDTLQSAESRDGIALFRQKSVDANNMEVYYISLNTPRPSESFQEFYRAEKCPPPEPYLVEHFGGDESALTSDGT